MSGAQGERLAIPAENKEKAHMKGKILIVEDEPIVALDLKQEIEQLGC